MGKQKYVQCTMYKIQDECECEYKNEHEWKYNTIQNELSTYFVDCKKKLCSATWFSSLALFSTPLLYSVNFNANVTPTQGWKGLEKNSKMHKKSQGIWVKFSNALSQVSTRDLRLKTRNSKLGNVTGLDARNVYAKILFSTPTLKNTTPSPSLSYFLYILYKICTVELDFGLH